MDPSAALPVFLRNAIVAMVRSDERDLSARQLGVFLICCTLPGPHTVRSLARYLNVRKGAITVAIDRLATEGLVQRKPDPSDRRSVNIAPTTAGMLYVRRLRSLLAEAAAAAEAGAGATPQPAAK